MRTAGGEGRLCSPAQTPDITMGEVLWRRCSSHRMVPRPLPQDKLSAILASGCAQIRIPRNQPAHGDRPDYGYLVGLDRVYDIFILAFDVSGLESGIYFYDLRNDRIELIRQGEFRQEAQRCLIGQAASLTSGAALFLTTDFRRIQYVYRHDRVIRNTFINAGRIMQALVLQATAFDLHTSITPAVNDRVACELLKLDPGESQVLYTLSLS